MPIDHLFSDLESVTVHCKPFIFIHVEALREDLHPNLLYHLEVISGPTTPYHILKNYSVLNGVQYHCLPSARRISHGVVMYTNEEDNDHADTLLKRTTDTAVTSELENIQVTSAMNFSVDHKESNVFNAVTNRLKKEKRFTGKSVRTSTST